MAPKLDHEKCEGCGNCVDVCPADVFEILNEAAHAARPDNCLDCGACAEECPAGAINLD